MKAISLTQDKIAIVDDEDYEKISNYPHPWRVDKRPNVFYAVSFNEKHLNVRMHRLIMNAQKGQQIDHINMNGLDNRKSNLRFVTNSQNHQNGIGRPRASSQYKGVSYLPICKNRRKIEKWQAYITKNGEQFYLGYYYNETIAAWIYDQVAGNIFGEYARFNLPQITN